MTTLGRLPVFTTPPKPRLLQPAPLLRRAAPFQRHARSITAAAGNSDSWWLKDKEHWTLVSSEDELQQVVQSAPNLVLVGAPRVPTPSLPLVDHHLSQRTDAPQKLGHLQTPFSSSCCKAMCCA